MTAKAFGASDTLLEILTRDWNSGGNGDGSVYQFSFAATGIEKLTLPSTSVKKVLPAVENGDESPWSSD